MIQDTKELGQGSKLAVQSQELRPQGSLEFSCGSLKFLQGAQRCTGFYRWYSTFKQLYKLQLSSLEKENLISSPERLVKMKTQVLASVVQVALTPSNHF